MEPGPPAPVPCGLADTWTTIALDAISAARYALQVISPFADRRSEQIFRRERVRRLAPDLQRAALRKLLMLDAAEAIEDLRVPPGNRLEKLTGGRRGQYGIRVNDQWRICFRWKDANAHDVEIVDYHD